MNKYFALRKTNRMRTKMLTEKSQEQLKEVIAYLQGWKALHWHNRY